MAFKQSAMPAFDPSTFTLRRFDPASDLDLLDAITGLLHAAYRPLLEDGLKYLATHQTSDITLDRLTAGESYLGFVGPDMVATITLEPKIEKAECDWFRRPGVFKFAQFGVHPDHKGTGIGSHIMDRIEDRARELGAAELAIDTSEHAHRLIDMYLRRGYRHVDEMDWAMTNYKSVVLSKTL